MQRTISEINIDAEHERLFHGFTQTATVDGHRVKLVAIIERVRVTEEFYAAAPKGSVRVGLIRLDGGKFPRRHMLPGDFKFNMRKTKG